VASITAGKTTVVRSCFVAMMTARSFLDRLPRAPSVALVLGSGLGDFVDTFESPLSIAYAEVPSMPVSAVAGHAGRFVFGAVDGVEVIAMQGRVHLYEGYTAEQVVFGLRLMIGAGARCVIVTNAAGGIRQDLRTSTLMLIEDHINLTGHNCLVGPHRANQGPRFPDMSHAYSPRLRKLAQRVAADQGIDLAEGIYAGMLGPSYETPAEIAMLRTLGASAVGMSTVQEVIAARQLGMPCLGISCITNPAAGFGQEPLRHEDVQAVAAQRKDDFGRLLSGIIAALPEVAYGI